MRESSFSLKNLLALLALFRVGIALLGFMTALTSLAGTAEPDRKADSHRGAGPVVAGFSSTWPTLV